MEIIPGIHQIRGRVANCFLVDDEELMLIDTGMPGNSFKITDYAEQTLKRKPQDIKAIIITHHHFDHVGSLDKMKEITRAKVAVHVDDAAYIRGEKPHAGSAFSNFMVKLLRIVYRSKTVEPDILLKDDDVIGGYQVIHTPGHTPGSICLYNPKNKAIFVGDNLRYTQGKLMSPDMRLLPEYEKYKESMKRISQLDVEVILTGHTKAVIGGGSELLREFVEGF